MLASCTELNDIENMLNRLLKNYPDTENFKNQMLELIRIFYLELPACMNHDLPTFDSTMFTQGKSFYPSSNWPLKKFLLVEAAEFSAPELEKAFSDTSGQIKKFAFLLKENDGLAEKFANLVIEKNNGKIAELTAEHNTSEDVVTFVMSNILQARAREIAKVAAPEVQSHEWSKGYCPICCARPKFSYIYGKEGVRNLVCSMCDHHWRFSRTSCPFCETDQPGNINLNFIEDAQTDRAEACETCMRYILATDMRQRPQEIPLAQFFPFGLMHLDILMAKKNYTPGCIE